MNTVRRSTFWTTFILVMLKIMLFRHFVFDNVEIVRLFSDAAAILTLMFVLELLTSVNWKMTVFTIFNIVMSLLLFACTVYFTFYGSMPTYTALSGANQLGQVQDSVTATIQTKDYLFFVDFVVLALLYAVTLRSKNRVTKSTRVGKPLYVAIALLLTIGASALYIRANHDISNELVQSERLGVLNYQVATAINARIENEAIADGSVNETQAALEQLESDYLTGVGAKVEAGSNSFFGVAKGMNVVVIQMESFQDILVGMDIDGQKVTPVLDDLIKNSFYFSNVFQQIGPGNTSDAEFLSNTGIYPTGDIAMSKGYGDRAIPSMPRLLAKYNYVSNTFHVNDVTFWNRNDLYPALGFTKYYDKPSFTDDKFNAFGASDEELYRVGMEKLSSLHDKNTPFYAQFITASSHHPFVIPEEFREIKLPAELEGKQLGHYIEAAKYTDKAIGDFIQALKDKGMYDNTVLVIYGDHFGMQTKDNDPAWVEQTLGMKYEERLSRFNIPLIIHVPGIEGQTSTKVGGQVDIMPTLANLLGLNLKDEGYTVFGRDLLNTSNNVIGMRYYMPTGSFFNDDIMFVPGTGFDDGTAYDINTLEPVADFSQYRDDYDYIMSLMKLSDEYVKLSPKR
nr:LTA synthase family protein [Paenibacillus sp. HB172176]